MLFIDDHASNTSLLSGEERFALVVSWESCAEIILLVFQKILVALRLSTGTLLGHLIAADAHWLLHALLEPRSCPFGRKFTRFCEEHGKR